MRGGKGGKGKPKGFGGDVTNRNGNSNTPQIDNSTRKGENWNVHNETGVVRNDKGEVTFVPSRDADGNTTYKPIEQTPHGSDVNRGRSSTTDNKGHGEYNPGGMYDTTPPRNNVVTPSNTSTRSTTSTSSVVGTTARVYIELY